MADIEYRDATGNDTEAIAALHADSWQRNYRGAYPDDYLDGPVVAERLGVWRSRLSAPAGDTVTVVAIEGDALAGFAHTIVADDPEHGSLLDNLHVAHAAQRRGVASQLFSETAKRLLQRDDAPPQLYLWVLRQNTKAQAFCDAIGGRPVEWRESESGIGTTVASIRYVWTDVRQLLA